MPRRSRIALASLAVALTATLALGPAPAVRADGSSLPLPAAKSFAGVASPANPTNPLAGGTWAVNRGFWENGKGLYNDYLRASLADQAVLGRAALQPSALWLTSKNSWAPTKVSDYLRTVNPNADPTKLVQVAVFGLWPRGEGKRKVKLTTAEQATYRTWIQRVSAGIGKARVLVALEPDLAITANPAVDGVKDPAVRQGLARFAAKYLHDHNPRAAVYLDAGASDWLSPTKAAGLLKRSGVQWTRGFSLDITHYTKAADNISQGAAIVSALAAQGVKGAHFVVDTADSGRGYTYAQWRKKFGTSTFDNSRTCSATVTTLCNALGVPPTWQVTAPGDVAALGLSAAQVAAARTSLDAYVWLTRPWMTNQASPYNHTKALTAARFTPFAKLF